MAIKETQTSRAEAMEAHKHALTEAALGHEQVVEFLIRIDKFLADLGRSDIEVITQTYLKHNGVGIRIVIAYDTLFPKQSETAAYRDEVIRMRGIEAKLHYALKQAGIKITTDMVIGTGAPAHRTHLTILKGIVGYQGVFSEEE